MTDRFRKRSEVLDLDGGAVAEDFGDAGHEFGGIVADADDAVGTEGNSMFGHLVVGIHAGLFTEMGKDGDVAAEKGLEGGAHVADDGTGADDDAADETEGADNFVAGQIETGGDEAVVHGGVPQVV